MRDGCASDLRDPISCLDSVAFSVTKKLWMITYKRNLKGRKFIIWLYFSSWHNRPTRPTRLCTFLNVLGGYSICFHDLYHGIQPALPWASGRSQSRDIHSKALLSSIVLRPAHNMAIPFRPIHIYFSIIISVNCH